MLKSVVLQNCSIYLMSSLILDLMSRVFLLCFIKIFEMFYYLDIFFQHLFPAWKTIKKRELGECVIECRYIVIVCQGTRDYVFRKICVTYSCAGLKGRCES